MGFLARQIKNLSLEDPAQPLLPMSALMESLGLGKSDAGVMVNEKQAMRLTTAFACITVITSDLSSLPFGIFQTLPDSSIREATDHRLYPMLHDAPNDKMTSMSWRAAMLAGGLGWGNAYSIIRRDRANRPVALDWLPPDRTNPAMKDGELFYVTTATTDGMPAAIDKEDMIHIKGTTLDGIVGLSPIGTCRNAFGLALAAEKFGAQFFGNGARATGTLEHPGVLDDEAYENLKKSFREIATGDNALRPLILEEGMKWTQMSIAPNDAQFLQTRQFQRAEIAGLFRVPLHLLQDLQRATNNNIEHQSLDYIRYCLRPWAVRLEQECNAKLLSGTQFHTQHDFNEFQRGDFASQTTGFTTLRNIGVYSANDILRAMHQNPIPAEEGGDIRTVAINMMPLDRMLDAGNETEKPNDSDAETGGDEVEPITDVHRERILSTYGRLFRDAVGRITNQKKPDAKHAYKALHPIVASMATAILAAAGLAPKLTEGDEAMIAEYARDAAARSAQWSKPLAGTRAQAETQWAYTALRQKLIGEA